MTTTLRIAKTLLLLLLIVPFTLAQSAEKTLVKSFAFEKNETVTLHLPGTVALQTWDSPLLRVQISIVLDNGSEAVLKSLISAGRYNLTTENKDGQIFIIAPAMDKTVRIGGKPLEDTVRFLVFAPDNLSVKIKTPTDNSTMGKAF